MTPPPLTVVTPARDPAAQARTGDGPLAAAELALDMMGRAFEALAMLYEIRHPGEYAAQAGRLKEYIADNFRHVERDLTGDGLDQAVFRDAVLRVRDLFETVDQQVIAMHPAGAMRAA